MSEMTREALRALNSLLEGSGDGIPAATPSRGRTDLTVAFAVYDDFDGAFFTLHSLLLHHQEVLDRTELLILDNHPEGLGAKQLAAYATSSKRNIRYVPYTDVRSTAVRDVIFREASGDVVVVLDCHVLLEAGSLAAILRYYDDHPGSLDLLQGPMLSGDATHLASTQMDPIWRRGMFGVWGTDPRGEDPTGEPFDIPSQGLAAFACRRDAWPGINPHFRGFGGEEGYLHEKVRQAGGRSLCLPAFRWLHRFDRPRGVPYPIQWVDRIHNYLVGWGEIGYDLDGIYDHFSDLLPAWQFNKDFAEAERLIQSPARAFGGICVTSDPLRVAPWRAVLAEAVAAAFTVVRVVVEPQSVAEPQADHDGEPEQTPPPRLLAGLAQAVRTAKYRNWPSVLVVDERSRIDGALPDRITGAIAAAGAPAGDIILINHDAEGTSVTDAVVVRAAAYARVLEAAETSGGAASVIAAAAVITTAHDAAPPRAIKARHSSEASVPTPPVIEHVYVLMPEPFVANPRLSALAAGLGASITWGHAILDGRHPERGYAKTWRILLNAIAKERAGKAVLIVTGDAQVHEFAEPILRHALIEASGIDAGVLLLAAHDADSLAAHGEGHVHLRTRGSAAPTGMVLLPGAAQRLLDLIPDPKDDGDEFTTWLNELGSVPDYLSSFEDSTVATLWPALTVSPADLASDPSLIRRARLYGQSASAVIG